MNMPPLRWLIPGLLLAFFVLLAMAVAFLHANKAREEAVQAGLQQMRAVMPGLQRDLSLSLLEEKMAGAVAELSQVGIDPNLRNLLLAGDDDRVLIANRYALAGRPAAETEGYDPVVAAGVRSRNIYEEQIDRSAERLRFYYPVTIGGDGSSLRPDRRGVLFAEYDLQPFRRLRQKAVLHDTLIHLAGSLMLITAVAFILHCAVTRRLGRLAGAAGKLAAGDLAARTGLRGGDEIAAAGRAFDSMADQLEAKFHELEEARRHLQEKSGDLEAANHQLERALQEARDLAGRAEAATRAKGDFLSTMSHEIRTPLNAVLGFSDLLQGESLTPTANEYLGYIQSAGRHLLGVVDDILIFSSLEKTGLELSRIPWEIAPTVLAVLESMAPAAQAAGLELQHELDAALPPRILGDDRRVQQILLKLLGNAVKFTRHGRIVVRISWTPGDRADRGTLRIAVADTGIGMDAAALARLFQPFTQVDSSSTREYGGTGLGLAISLRLARAMGGDITVRSQPGEGSEFTLILPAEVVADAPVKTAAASGRPGVRPGLKVLLVEDNEPNRRTLGAILGAMGCEVHYAINGQQAVEAAGEGGWDAVLMDLSMPVMDGLEASRVLRAREAAGGRVLGSHGALHIVALTANAMPGDRERCLEAGMDGYLSKPVRRSELVEALAAL